MQRTGHSTSPSAVKRGGESEESSFGCIRVLIGGRGEKCSQLVSISSSNSSHASLDIHVKYRAGINSAREQRKGETKGRERVTTGRSGPTRR